MLTIAVVVKKSGRIGGYPNASGLFLQADCVFKCDLAANHPCLGGWFLRTGPRSGMMTRCSHYRLWVIPFEGSRQRSFGLGSLQTGPWKEGC
jgi:hypothetical protein